MKISNKKTIKILTLSVFLTLVFFSVNVYAAERNNDDKWFKVGLYGMAGTGFEEYDFGQNSHNEDVEFYGGGGGIGGLLTIGGSPFDRVDLEISAGYQKYDDEEVPYTNVEFRKFLYQVTLKYEIARFKSSNFKIGIGAGLYADGRLIREIDGDNKFVEYDDAVGYHALLEYELLYENSWALVFGAKVYTVEYEAEKYTDNGVNNSVNSLESELKDFNGDGMDLMVGVVKYF